MQCSKCDRKFCTEKAVKRHYLAIHENKNPNIHCPRCGNFQLSPEDLDHHLQLGDCTENVKKKITINKKKYNCKYCNKLFSHKHYCKTHERIHTGERPFKCQYCEKTFKQYSTLSTHLILHTGKNISCTLCDKKFTRESFLKIHMRRHTKERPYACELCPQNYTQKCHLQTHIQTAHSIEKPYKCDFCYMKFSRKDLFQIHIFTHIGRPYKCPECSVEYSVSYRFRKHLIKSHAIYEDPSNFKRDIIYDPNTLQEINDIMNEHNITKVQNEKN